MFGGSACGTLLALYRLSARGCAVEGTVSEVSGPGAAALLWVSTL